MQIKEKVAISDDLHNLAGAAGFEPTKWRNQNPLPYHLATPQLFFHYIKLASKLQELKDFFNEKLGSTIEHCINNKEREADLILECKSLSTKLVNEIDKMGPFGAGNHKPKIILKNVVILKIDLIGKNKTNLRLLVADDDINKLSNSVVAMCFRSGENDDLYKSLKRGDKISLFGELNINNWMGKQSIQFIIEDFLK